MTTWNTITPDSASWADTAYAVKYVKDQNEDIVTDQNGEPMTTHEGMELTDWTNISDISAPTPVFLDIGGCVDVMEESEPVVTLENFQSTDDVLDLNLLAHDQWGDISSPTSSWSNI